MLNQQKISREILHICLRHVSEFTLKKPKRSFSTVLFIHTSDYLRYLSRKQTETPLPTPLENVTTLTCEMLNFFSD